MSSDMAIKAKRLINKKVWKLEKYYDSDEHKNRYQYLGNNTIRICDNYPLSEFDIKIISKFENVNFYFFNHSLHYLPQTLKQIEINIHDNFDCEKLSLDYLPIQLESLIIYCESTYKKNLTLYNLPPYLKKIEIHMRLENILFVDYPREFKITTNNYWKLYEIV